MEMLRDIPGFSSWCRILPVDKGWSGEQKYHIFAKNGQEYLLRLSSADSFSRKELEFCEMEKLARFPQLLLPRPLSLGRCGNGEKVYTLLTWLHGEDMEAALPPLSPQMQYRLGLQAGEALRCLHSLPAPATQPPWESRFNAKIDRKFLQYHACPLRFADDDALLRLIEQTRPLLAGRPQSFQHGDYHVGNLLLSPDGQVGILDFNRIDFGDPWEEFNRIPWCAQCSPFFATGRIDGYFGDSIPADFFPLLALYICANQLSSLPWAIPFGQKEIDTMLAQAAMVSKWYAGFTHVVPSWYRKP